MERRPPPLLLLLLLCWPPLGPVLAQVRHPVPVLWMMPVSTGAGRENVTAAVAPAIRLALRDLRREPPPLGNYELQLQLLDSQCDPATSLKALFDAMWAGPRYLLVFGGMCPSVTALIARALPALRLVQVSFVPPPPSLSNRKRYGNLFSTAPSDRALNLAAVKLLQHFRWQRVGIVTQDGARLSEMKKDLMTQLLKADIQVVSTGSISEDACSALRRLKESDVRIIIGLYEESSASKVFCCAYRLNMFGARYQWLVVAGATTVQRPGWQVSGCSVDTLLTAAHGSIRLQSRALGEANTAGVSGRTPDHHMDAYLAQLIQEGSEVSPLHTFAYDAVWLAARAVSQVMEAAKHRQRMSKNGSVSEEQLYRMLLDAVAMANFTGVTGDVFFGGGDRMTSIELIQLQGSGSVLVGHFWTSSQQLSLRTPLLRFPGPGPAGDRMPVVVRRLRVSLLQYAIVSSAAAVTAIAALSGLVFAALSRKRWCGYLEQLLLLGVLLSCSSVLVSGLDAAPLSSHTLELLCSVRLWTLSLGHSLAFASLFSKVWSVYWLCGRHTYERPAGGVLLWMFLLDVFVLTSWQILDPLRWVELQRHSQGDGADQDVIVHSYSEHCSDANMELWLTAIYGYKGPLLGLGCFLAWSVRKVSSKRLTLSMFAVTVFSVSGAAGSLLTSHNPSVHFCLSGVLIVCCNAVTLALLLRPKQLWLVTQDVSKLQSNATEEKGEEHLSWNQQLKSRAAQLDAELEDVTQQLSDALDQKLHHQLTAMCYGHVTHVAQVCSEDGHLEGEPLSPDTINSPEHVWRRLSVTLPILHHSYLPAVGGVSASTSSLFGSREAFVHHDLLTTTSC